MSVARKRLERLQSRLGGADSTTLLLAVCLLPLAAFFLVVWVVPILYALGIGAGRDPLDGDELRFVYENAPAGFRVFPTFATTFGHDVMWQILALPSLDVNPMLLHGEHSLELPGRLPDSATLTNGARIAAIYDKGSGALFQLEVRSEDEQGREVALNRYAVFVRGLGGFGGERGPSSPARGVPERSPDAVHSAPVAPNQALIYRLSGDRNPLHADPRMARIGGYKQPILHGLSTFGMGVRALLAETVDYDVGRFRSAHARFSRHVFPGETLITEMWKEDGAILFQSRVVERDEIVLANGRLHLTATGASHSHN